MATKPPASRNLFGALWPERPRAAGQAGRRPSRAGLWCLQGDAVAERKDVRCCAATRNQTSNVSPELSPPQVTAQEPRPYRPGRDRVTASLAKAGTKAGTSDLHDGHMDPHSVNCRVLRVDVHTPSELGWHGSAEETSNETSNSAGIDDEIFASSTKASNETSNSNPHHDGMDLHGSKVAKPGEGPVGTKRGTGTRNGVPDHVYMEVDIEQVPEPPVADDLPVIVPVSADVWRAAFAGRCRKTAKATTA
jgi:hypothetical protein